MEANAVKQVIEKDSRFGKKFKDSTLVIGQYRVPYDWVTIPFNTPTLKENLRIRIFSFSEMGSLFMSTRSLMIMQQLQPDLVFMTGVCAGNPKDTRLGDICVATKAFSVGAGKVTDKGLRPEMVDFAVHWNINTAAQRVEIERVQKHLPEPPVPLQVMAEWVMSELMKAKDNTVPADDLVRAIQSKYGSGSPEIVIAYMRDPRRGYIHLNDKRSWGLTANATSYIYTLDEQGKILPQEYNTSVKIVSGVFAVSEAVIDKEHIWEELEKRDRKVVAIEMESAGLLHAVDMYNQSSLIDQDREIFPMGINRTINSVCVKGVMDVASGKDDRFKEFAAKSSGAWAWEFILQWLGYKD